VLVKKMKDIGLWILRVRAVLGWIARIVSKGFELVLLARFGEMTALDTKGFAPHFALGLFGEMTVLKSKGLAPRFALGLFGKMWALCSKGLVLFAWSLSGEMMALVSKGFVLLIVLLHFEKTEMLRPRCFSLLVMLLILLVSNLEESFQATALT
jgi:hypothetical protein